MENQIKLKDNEYLLKVATIPHESREEYRKVGFLTKLNKNGTVPKNFTEWKPFSNTVTDPKIHVEEFSYGWSLLSYRRGASADWAVLSHPKGFVVEVKLAGFLEMLKHTKLSEGNLIDAFKWSPEGLVKRL